MIARIKNAVLLILLVGSVFHSQAQVFTDTLSAEEAAYIQKILDQELKQSQRKYAIQFLPLIYYTPETRMAFGAGSIIQFKFDFSDSLLKKSRVVPSFVYTQNKQMLAQVGFDLHTHRNWRVFGDVGYFIYPYFFGGIGNSHSGDSLEWYDARYPKVNLNVYRQVINAHFSIGLRYDFQDSRIKPQRDDLADLGDIPGASGSSQSNIGVGAMYDSRDFLLSPTKGMFADVSVMWADDWSGATYSDQFIRVDLRKYIPLSKKHDLIALQLYSELHNGDVPFNLMSMLGGQNRMRGYKEGVFRDRQMLVYQVEYRSRLFFKYVGFALFANLGGIGTDFEDVNANYRYTVGGGLRFTPIPSERYFVRMDYGIGKNTQGFYIAIGEAF